MCPGLAVGEGLTPMTKGAVTVAMGGGMFMTDVGGATDGFTESFNPFDSATFEFMLTGELVPFTCFSLLALPMLGMGRGSRFSSIMRLV